MIQPPSTNNSLDPVKLTITLSIFLLVALTLFTSFFSARGYAKSQIVQKDINLIQKFMEAYKQDHGHYPASVRNQPVEYEKYLESIPQPVADSNCADQKYIYETLNQGQAYKISYCIEGQIYSAVSN